MNQSLLDNQGGGAEDDHLARIVRLETNMDNVTAVLNALQRKQEEHHQYMVEQFDRLKQFTLVRTDSLRDQLQDRMDRGFARVDEKIDAGFQRVDEKIDGGFQRVDEKIDGGFQRVDEKMDRGFQRLNEKIDRFMYWTIGLVAANTIAVGGIIIRLVVM